MRPLKDLAALVGQIGLAIITGDMFEKDGLPRFLVDLTLPGLLALGLFELDLHLGSLAILFGVDSICNTTPKG